MSQPLDRTARIESKGDIDHEAGEFWVENPFEIVQKGENLSAYESNRFYLNVDGKDFINVSFASQADLDADSRSAIVADFNNDNRNDLLVANVGGGPIRLFLNQFETTGHYLRVNLVGSKSNRQGIGSRIEVAWQDSGEKKKLVREVFAPMGFMGQSPPTMLIGVGDAQQLDSVTVNWPSGEVQRFEDVAVDQEITIKEDQEKFVSK